MAMMIKKWRPSWWTDEVHGSAWERVKGAMERDWAQTKNDVGVGGAALEQSLTDTVEQAAGTEHLPTMNETNAPRVVASWDETQVPYDYGYSAFQEFGARDPHWNTDVENRLKREWIADQDTARLAWEEAPRLIRRGYEFRDTADTWPGGFHPDNDDAPEAITRRTGDA